MSFPGFRPFHLALHGVLIVPLATNYCLSSGDEGKMMAKCLGALPPFKTKLLSLLIAICLFGNLSGPKPQKLSGVCDQPKKEIAMFKNIIFTDHVN